MNTNSKQITFLQRGSNVFSLFTRKDHIDISKVFLVFIDRCCGEDFRFPRISRIVSIDQYRGARSAVQHLVELGHTRIVHVAGPISAPDSAERIRGWRDELAQNGLPMVDPIHGNWTAEGGYRVGLELDVEPGSAIFTSNDLSAMGLLSALRERGLRVPEDVSVVGFDDVPEAGYLFPPLTTVRQDFAALGRQMMQKVLVSLEEHEDDNVETPLPTELIVRSSTQQR